MVKPEGRRAGWGWPSRVALGATIPVPTATQWPPEKQLRAATEYLAKNGRTDQVLPPSEVETKSCSTALRAENVTGLQPRPGTLRDTYVRRTTDKPEHADDDQQLSTWILPATRIGTTRQRWPPSVVDTNTLLPPTTPALAQTKALGQDSGAVAVRCAGRASEPQFAPPSPEKRTAPNTGADPWSSPVSTVT